MDEHTDVQIPPVPQDCLFWFSPKPLQKKGKIGFPNLITNNQSKSLIAIGQK